MKQKLILDVDTGTDDAVAIMMAALHPDLELIGVTTVNGNVPVENCTDNTLRVLDNINRSVPVYEGLSRPLARMDFPVARAFRQAQKVETTMHGLTLELPSATSRKSDQHAVNYLIETFNGTDADEIVLIATGPLSNLAAAFALDPQLAQKIPKVIIMGGAHALGNVTPSAEFNIWADPEAARVTFLSGIRDLTVVPLDATHEAIVSLDDCQRLRALGTPAGDAAALFIERRIHAHDSTQPLETLHTAAVHDALCVAALVQPSVIETVDYFVDVETAGEIGVGTTFVDTNRRAGKEPNCHFAMHGDAGAFVDLMIKTLAAS